MIVCLDGAFGVGKTTIAEKLKDKFPKVEIIDSDFYYQKWIKEDPFSMVLGGTLPQNNSNFVNRYRNLLKEKAINREMIIVSVMSLTDDVSYKGIVKQLKSEGYNIIHIILEANENVLQKRLMNDKKRECILEHRMVRYSVVIFEE